MTEERMYELLRDVGEAYARDIESDRRGDVELGLAESVDVGFECYVREVDGELVGYVYMGECGEWAFRANGDRLEDDPSAVDRVKKLTPYAEW